MMDLKKKMMEVHRELEGMCPHLWEEWVEQSLHEMLQKSDRKFSCIIFLVC